MHQESADIMTVHHSGEVTDSCSTLRIFRHIGDVSMGLALEGIVAIEEKTLLAAHVAMLLGRYDQAEQLFLKSSQPKEALS
ncbi:hypothetical protein ANCDUO_16368, partial [Ancylostoma duodenale]